MFLCSICKNKNFLYKRLGSFIQKFFFLWHKQQLLFKKIYKYPFFFFYSSVQISSVFLRPTFNCTLSSPILGRELPPPVPSRTFCIYSAERRARGGGLPLRRSRCRGTAAAGTGGGSSCARCRGTAGSSRSSPRPTGTGCAAWAAAAPAPSRS